MGTQIKTLNMDKHLGISPYDSEESMLGLSREEYISRASRLWSHRRIHSGLENGYTNETESDIADVCKYTINMGEEYEWLTCYIWLSEGHNIADIDRQTILINGKIKIDPSHVKSEGQFLMLKLPWSQVKEILKPGQIEIVIGGRFLDGTTFEGSDMVTVTDTKSN